MSKDLQDGHLGPPIDYPLILNADDIDSRIYRTLADHSWTKETTYPLCRNDFLRANIGTNRVRPSIGQCLITCDLLTDIYEGSAKILVDIDIPGESDFVPHYIFWKDAYKVCDTEDIGAIRLAASEIIHKITSGQLSLEESPFSDITGDQFPQGSKILFIDPLSDLYVNSYIAHLELDKSLTARRRALRERFTNDFRAFTDTDLEALKTKINPPRPS
jgi:hypothetical protein